MNCIANIKRIKQEKKLTNEQLSELSGISNGTLNKILADKNASIKLETVFALAEALEVSPLTLIGISDNDFSDEENDIINMMRELDDQKRRSVSEYIKREYEKEMTKRRTGKMLFTLEAENTRTIPLYETPVSAGCGNYLDADCSKEISLNLNEITERADFAVRVRGDSMMPRYNDGDIVIVESVSSVDIGKIGIFILNGESYIKKLGKNMLISLNQKYSAIPFGNNDNIECKGLVIGKLSRLA